MARAKTALITLFVALNAAPVLAQTTRPAPGNPMQGTQAEQNACERDAVRFCRNAVPDTFRVLACLQANHKKISKACRAVLISHGQL